MELAVALEDVENVVVPAVLADEAVPVRGGEVGAAGWGWRGRVARGRRRGRGEEGGGGVAVATAEEAGAEGDAVVDDEGVAARADLDGGAAARRGHEEAALAGVKLDRAGAGAVGALEFQCEGGVDRSRARGWGRWGGARRIAPRA